MREVYGIGDFRYEYVDGWGKLPEGVTFQECPGVAVDARDNVYVLTRGQHPIMVFDREGNYLRSFGQGYFSDRTHGLYIAHDSSLLVADDGIHTIQKFTTDGDQVLEIGKRRPLSGRATATSTCPMAMATPVSTCIRVQASTNFPGVARALMPANSS